MGADLILHYSCRPKQELGAGDVRVGTEEMVRLLKLGRMARFLEDQARKQGKQPDDLSVARQVRDATTGEVVEQAVRYAALRQAEERLTRLAPHCATCPVNVLDQSFGCYGSLRYPIRAKSEEWLMSRLQPADTPGGFLCRKAVRDLGYDGAPIRRWRDSDAARIFELPRPVQRSLDPARPEETTVDSDQIWHALLGLGPELQPFHCLYVPLWVGAVLLDGVVPDNPDHLRQIADLKTFEERRARTGFDAGPTDQGPEVFAIQRLLFACYTAWLRDVPLLVDA